MQPSEMSQSQIRDAVESLPQGIKSRISGIAKHQSPIYDAQSPEELRKANLKALKTKRRELIAELVELDKEIYLTEEITMAEAFNPAKRREDIMSALTEAAKTLGRQNLSLSEVRELHPLPDIAYSSWIAELTKLHHERKLFYHDGLIIVHAPRPKGRGLPASSFAILQVNSHP